MRDQARTYLRLEVPTLPELLHASDDLLSAEALRLVSDEAGSDDLQDVFDLWLHLFNLLILAAATDVLVDRGADVRQGRAEALGLERRDPKWFENLRREVVAVGIEAEPVLPQLRSHFLVVFSEADGEVLVSGAHCALC